MNSTFQLSTLRAVSMGLTGVLAIVLPLVFALWARWRLKASWRYLGYGALIFLVFQVLTRIPLIVIAQRALGPQLAASRGLQAAGLAVLVLTSGLFEEVGRYVGYRWLLRKQPKTWAGGVVYGIGHGGFESLIIVGVPTLLTLANLILLPSVLPSLPQAQRELVTQQLAAVGATPEWLSLIGGYERVWTMFIHIALSLVVLQVFLRTNIRWLWVSIGLHALVNVVVFISLLGLDPATQVIISEAWVTVCGIVAIWAIFRLRGQMATGIVASVPDTTEPGAVASGG